METQRSSIDAWRSKLKFRVSSPQTGCESVEQISTLHYEKRHSFDGFF